MDARQTKAFSRLPTPNQNKTENSECDDNFYATFLRHTAHKRLI